MKEVSLEKFNTGQYIHLFFLIMSVFISSMVHAESPNLTKIDNESEQNHGKVTSNKSDDKAKSKDEDAEPKFFDRFNLAGAGVLLSNTRGLSLQLESMFIISRERERNSRTINGVLFGADVGVKGGSVSIGLGSKQSIHMFGGYSHGIHYTRLKSWDSEDAVARGKTNFHGIELSKNLMFFGFKMGHFQSLKDGETVNSISFGLAI